MLFAIGGVGLLIRRNPLVMFMCVELMLNAVNLTFVTFGKMLNDISGQVIVFFVLVVAAAEVVVGLGHRGGLLPAPAGRRCRRPPAAEGIGRAMVNLVWLDPCPAPGRVLLLWFFGKRIGEPLAGGSAPSSSALSFVAHPRGVRSGSATEPEHTFEVDVLHLDPVGRLPGRRSGSSLDPLSMAMILFVTGVGALIHLYSIGYMHGDSRFPRFFTYLNLFVFSMLILVLGDNMLLTFLGWEGVGACSYLLISFWFEKETNASAGKKAFVTNRVGDWGFMVAMFMAFFTFGIAELDHHQRAQAPGLAADHRHVHRG